MATQLLTATGALFGWGDIDIRIFGRSVIGVTAISFTDDSVVENIFGRGRKPIGVGRGRIEYSGSITLKLEEVLELERLVLAEIPGSNGALSDIIPFDITITGAKLGGTQQFTDVLVGVTFRNQSREFNEGSTSLDITVDFLFNDIVRRR